MGGKKKGQPLTFTGVNGEWAYISQKKAHCKDCKGNRSLWEMSKQDGANIERKVRGCLQPVRGAY